MFAIAASPGVGHAQTLVYGSDFEAPLYSLGPVGDTAGAPNSGQDGWAAQPRAPYSAAPSPWVTVSDVRATSGANRSAWQWTTAISMASMRMA